jgi:hypothetical protein
MKNEGKAAALVAVARRIAVLLHRMWIDATEFRFGSEAAAWTKTANDSDPGRIVRADDGMDEAEYDCCA